MLPQPRLRFLLADDPGAGKTIMAGLLKEHFDLDQHLDAVLMGPGHPLYAAENDLADPQTGYRDPVEAIRRIEVKGRSRGYSIRLTTNEWHKAAQLGDSYWLYVVWDPLGTPDPEPLRIRNPVRHLNHAKREVVTARQFDISGQAIQTAARATREDRS